MLSIWGDGRLKSPLNCLQRFCLAMKVLKESDCKEIQPIHFKGDQPWVFFGRNNAKAETPVLWPPHAKSWLVGKDWCWAGLGVGGEGDDRGWDGWMASLTRWTWVWVNSRSWWWTGRPGVLLFMGSQRVGHDWVTELNWTHWISVNHWDRESSSSPLLPRAGFYEALWPPVDSLSLDAILFTQSAYSGFFFMWLLKGKLGKRSGHLLITYSSFLFWFIERTNKLGKLLCD